MRRRQRGSVFILTVGVLAALVAILAAAAATQQVHVSAVTNRMEARRARLAAESAIQRALATFEAQDLNQALQQDEWFTLGQEGAERFVVTDGSFRVQIADASSLININTATQEQLERLPLTTEQIESLLDWREDGQTPRTDGGKDEYYNALTVPYNAKLRRLDTYDELLLIKGWNARMLFEPPTDIVTTNVVLPQKPNGEEQTLYDLTTVDSSTRNFNAEGTQKPNIATVQGAQALVAQGIPQPLATLIFNGRGGFTSYRALLSVPGMTVQSARILLNTYAVTAAQQSPGKINVNTASEAVLTSLLDLPPDVASAIISRQGTGFTGLGDLFDVPGYSLQVAQQTADLFATNSQMFLIRAVGTAGRTSVSLEALVTLTDNGAQVTRIWQLPIADMTSHWGWQADTTAETVLKEAS